MSVSFQFKRNGEAVALSKIDDLLRDDLGLPPSKDNNCREFNLITDLGVGILIIHSGSVVTKEKFDATTKDFERESEDDIKLDTLARKYLYEEYEFHAWR